MTKQKDLKRLVRARMEKTGESYAAARAQVVSQQGGRTPPVTIAEYPLMAGMSDDAVRKQTERTWREWVRELDGVRAHELSHKEIATLLRETYGVGSWWAQAVTVGYERIRGLRDKHQRRGGSYDANKSKTFPVGVADLYAAFATARGRRRWLADAKPTVRTSKAETSVRFDWGDGTSVQAYFTSKGPAKSMVQVQHSKLADRDEVDKRKAYWAARFADLASALGS